MIVELAARSASQGNGTWSLFCLPHVYYLDYTILVLPEGRVVGAKGGQVVERGREVIDHSRRTGATYILLYLSDSNNCTV